jgi:hypothetical protein
MQVYSQKKAIKSKIREDQDSTCRWYFIKKLIIHGGFSDDIFVPVIISNERYRMMIKSEYLYRYFKVMDAKNENQISSDTTFVDTTNYLKKIQRIINGKEKLIFNNGIFKMFVPKGEYLILDKQNPYSKEIGQYGLINFIKKRLFEMGRRDDNIFYQLIPKEEYSTFNEYNYTYLIEALFKYNFIYQHGDINEVFIKIDCHSKDL